eukprot:5548097-Prymnesium_polylepis.1
MVPSHVRCRCVYVEYKSHRSKWQHGHVASGPRSAPSRSRRALAETLCGMQKARCVSNSYKIRHL